MLFFFFQAEDGIRDDLVTGVQTCALPIVSISSRNDVEPATAQTVRMSATARAIWLEEWVGGSTRIAARVSRDRGGGDLAVRSEIPVSVARRCRRRCSAALSEWTAALRAT